MQPDRVLDEFASFLLGLTFRIAALQRGTDRNETAVFVLFNDHREFVILHSLGAPLLFYSENIMNFPGRSDRVRLIQTDEEVGRFSVTAAPKTPLRSSRRDGSARGAFQRK